MKPDSLGKPRVVRGRVGEGARRPLPGRSHVQASIAAAVSLINAGVAWRDLGTADETSAKPWRLASWVRNERLEPCRAHHLYRRFRMDGPTSTKCTRSTFGKLAQPRFDFESALCACTPPRYPCTGVRLQGVGARRLHSGFGFGVGHSWWHSMESILAVVRQGISDARADSSLLWLVAQRSLTPRPLGTTIPKPNRRKLRQLRMRMWRR